MEELFKFDAKRPEASSSTTLSPPAQQQAIELKHIATSTDEAVCQPAGIVVLPNEKICVASEGTGKVVALSSDGKRIKQPAKMPTFLQPTALVQDGASFYVADGGAHQVTRLALKDMSPACSPAGSPGAGPAQLQLPRGLALHAGTLYVSDCNNHRICRYHHLLLEPCGDPFGGQGSDAGQLRYPHGLAVLDASHTPHGGAEIVVADAHNHRIQCFSPDGQFVRAAGEFGTAAGDFDEPVGVAAARGALIVAERVRVQILAAYDLSPQRVVPLPGAVALAGIALGKGRAYVTDREGSTIHILDIVAAPPSAVDVADAEPSATAAQGAPAAAEPPPAAPPPAPPPAAVPPPAQSVVVTLESPDLLSCVFEILRLGTFLPAASVCSLWAQVARDKAGEMARLEWRRALGAPRPQPPPTPPALPKSGPATMVTTTSDTPPAGLSYPTHVTQLASGCLLVVESATNQLLLLSPTGTPLSAFGTAGSGPSDFRDPRGIALYDGGVVVADARNRRLLRRRLEPPSAESHPPVESLGEATLNSIDANEAANTDHALEATDASLAAFRPDGLAYYPVGANRGGGALFVTDKGRHRVCCFEAATLVARWATASKGDAPGCLCDPGGLVVHAHADTECNPLDELVVADVSNHRLSVFTLDGLFVRTIGRRGHAPGCFHLPSAVASAHGLLIVAERRRVQVLTSAGVPQQVIVPPHSSCSLNGLCVANEGSTLMVADFEGRCVHEFALRR